MRIINCARGGLVDEGALRALLDSGHVAGAAFDVFMNEPATENPLFGHPNVVCTPHLGASTSEAQENVALQVAEQMSDYLIRDAISNAVNFPSITSEEAPKLKPFIALAERLGSFAGQLVDSAIKKVTITYEGDVATLKTKALTASAIAGLLRPLLEGVNVVSDRLSLCRLQPRRMSAPFPAPFSTMESRASFRSIRSRSMRSWHRR